MSYDQNRPIVDVRMILQGMLGRPLIIDGELVTPDALALVVLKYGEDLEQQDIDDPDLLEDEDDLVEAHLVVIEHNLEPMYDDDETDTENSVASTAIEALTSHIALLESIKEMGEGLSLDDLLGESGDEDEN